MTDRFWPRIRRHLRQELGPEEFSTWFDGVEVEESGDRVTLKARSRRVLDTWSENYRGTLDRACEPGPGEEPCSVRLALAEAPARPAPRSTDLNPAYTFDRFVVGNSNQFAHAAARAVADNPAKSYNPLFIYGGVGLGKTHLLHAIGHHLRVNNPQLKVHYVASEQFVNELIASLRFNRMPSFREKHRENIDVLLVDDIQFLAGKERTQEEFFHTFNTLYTDQKQIILSSDHSPHEIPTLEERLRSRFQWGLIADLQPPELETKVAILRGKAAEQGASLPTDVADFIARQVRSNVRELEGMLIRVLAFSDLTGKPLSLDLAKETLKGILPADKRVNPNEVVRTVARHYGLKVGEIKSKTNSRQIVFPRQVSMYLCKELTDLSFPEIGKIFGKHHSTVMHSVERIEKLRADDQDLNRTLTSLKRQFT
jgi:chromosomal replication initiator protein